MTPEQVKQVQQMIKDAVDYVLKFSTRKLGDTPTDALQLTPKKYVDGIAGVPAGSNMDVQFNDGGVAGGEDTFKFDKATNTIILGQEGTGNGGKLDGVTATTTDADGGFIVVEAGNGNGAGNGGELDLYGGSGDVSGNGGKIVLSAGGAGASSGTNGYIDIQSGYVSAVATYSPGSGATATLDLTTANEHRITMPAGNAVIAVSNATNGQKFIVSITQDSGGSRTVTWFTTIRWAGGVAPTLTTTANKRDTFGFVCTSGSTFDGFVVGQNI